MQGIAKIGLTWRGFALELNTEALSDAIHERKVCYDEGQIEDGAVAPACIAETRNVRVGAGPRFKGEFYREVQQSAFSLGNGRLRVVADNRLDQSLIAS